MTTETDQMPEFVTRTEFQMALLKVDQRFDAVDQRFDAVDQRFDTFEQRFDTFEQRLSSQIARMFGAFEENMRREFRVLDDKYNDLPPRVARIEAAELPLRVAKLEATVFPPPAPAKRAKRRRAG